MEVARAMGHMLKELLKGNRITLKMNCVAISKDKKNWRIDECFDVRH